jgi:hypothetical protein
VSRDGKSIGKVDDLLIDPTRMKVGQLDVDIKGGDHAHVPAQDVQIDRARREVRMRATRQVLPSCHDGGQNLNCSG